MIIKCLEGMLQCVFPLVRKGVINFYSILPQMCQYGYFHILILYLIFPEAFIFNTNIFFHFGHLCAISESISKRLQEENSRFSHFSFNSPCFIKANILSCIINYTRKLRHYVCLFIVHLTT